MQKKEEITLLGIESCNATLAAVAQINKDGHHVDTFSIVYICDSIGFVQSNV